MTERESVDVEVWSGLLLGEEWHAGSATAEVSDIGPFGIVGIDVFAPVEGQIDDWVRYFLRISPPPPSPRKQTIDLYVELPEGLGFDDLFSWGIYDYETPSWWDEGQLPGDLIHDALVDEDPEQLLAGLFGLTGAPFVMRRPDTGPR
jgi:hypothetical protein